MVSRLNILIGGQAGQGINELAASIGRILTRLGYYVFDYRDYQSRISGGHNFNILCIGEKPVGSFDNEIDILVALDEATLEIHNNELKKSTIIISESKGIKVNSAGIIEKNKLDKKVTNVIYASVLLQILGVDKKLLVDELNEIFKGKSLLPQDLKAVEFGYKLNVKNKFSLKGVGKQKYLLSGSSGIVSGAVDSGLDLYFAYPMTPATPVLHELALIYGEDVKVVQPENEIAVVNMALGASFTGRVVMAGTSGGGFDLMTEAISMQGISEIPLVIYLAQRQGPGTGVPTYTSQADLNIAVYAGHGDFPRVVVAPGDAEEAMQLTNQAFYFSQKYRVLSIILSDKHLAESKYAFDKMLKINKIQKQQGCENNKNYEITKDGLSKMCIPGQGIAKASAYEHDEYGFTIEDAEKTKQMQDKRKRKWQTMKQEVLQQETTKLYGNKNAENLLIGWGSTKGSILDFVNQNKNFKFMQVLYLEPFPVESVKKEINKTTKVFVIENNATGQLADLIARNTGIIISDKNRILKYDSRAFTPQEINKMLKGK